jgi:hypothetical protein
VSTGPECLPDWKPAGIPKSITGTDASEETAIHSGSLRIDAERV